MKNKLFAAALVQVSFLIVTSVSLSGCVLIKSDNKEKELFFNTLSTSAVRLLNNNEHCTYYNAERERQCKAGRKQQVEQINQAIRKHHDVDKE